MKQLVKAMLGLNTMSLVALFRLKPGRFVLSCHSAFHAARSSVDKSGDIPEIGLGEILAGRRPAVRIEFTSHEDGMLPIYEAFALMSIMVAEQPRAVLEIGTYMGSTSRLLAENLERAVIHTIDLPTGYSRENDDNGDLPKDDFHLIARRKVGREYQGKPCASRIRQHFGDTAVWDFREAGHPTCFFIDGAHTYEYCRNDSEKCFALCGGRGVFIWHDCDCLHPGVVRFLTEWRQQGRDIKRISGTAIAYWKSGNGDETPKAISDVMTASSS
jgi:hypothetical protein